MELWPHQSRGVAELIERINRGETRLCLTAPTGGGKSVMMVELVRYAQGRNWQAVVYTPRKLLIEQLARTFERSHIRFGVRAAEFVDLKNLDLPVQISSPATENARCFGPRASWELHDAQLVLVDEIHLQKGEVMARIMQHHRERGAVIVIITATPIGVSKMADAMVVAGTNSELRQCGALLPCYVYGCEEVDTAKIRPRSNGEFSYADIKSVWPPEIFGYVVQHYEELNPEKKPSILFAPGVAESVWFAERFCAAGYRWAHIDGEDCWLDGQLFKSNRVMRDRILSGLADRSIQGVCNRFVMREGIDIPHLYHGILATPIGSLVSYIQVVGRLLRACPGLDHVVIQDHGGNWWRHGSPNQDRAWPDYWQAPEQYASQVRADAIRSKKEPQPIHCPKCHAIRTQGAACHQCGFRHECNTRLVIEHSGKLREMKGDIFKPLRREYRNDSQKLWDRYYHGAKRSGRTFRQAEAYFFINEHYYPPRDLQRMPMKDTDWYRQVKEVPTRDLTGVPAWLADQEPPKPQSDRREAIQQQLFQ